MLFIVTQSKKQFGKKTFKNIANLKKHDCLHHFKLYFGLVFYTPYIGILQEWITQYTCWDVIENFKMLPFTEELIFVLFNFFATHGKCLQINV